MRKAPLGVVRPRSVVHSRRLVEIVLLIWSLRLGVGLSRSSLYLASRQVTGQDLAFLVKMACWLAELLAFVLVTHTS